MTTMIRSGNNTVVCVTSSDGKRIVELSHGRDVVVDEALLALAEDPAVMLRMEVLRAVGHVVWPDEVAA